MIHAVYKTTNILNNKYYIGKHSSERPNDDYLGSGIALQRAIKKYGVENFRKEILFLYENEVEAYNKEREILVELDGVKDPLCYNLCYGGVGFWKGSKHSMEARNKISEGNRGKTRTDEAKLKYSTAKKGIPKSEIHKQRLSECNLGKKLDDETKKKISVSNIGRVQTSDTREKISKSHKGRPSIRKGTQCSEETKQKMSIAQKGKKKSEEHRKQLSVAGQGNRNSNYGKMWITNGTTNRKIYKTDSIPDNWHKGRSFPEGYK